MSGKPALSAAARDWWITLEANEDDVAGYVLGVQLLAAPPEVRRRAEPAARLRHGARRRRRGRCVGLMKIFGGRKFLNRY